VPRERNEPVRLTKIYTRGGDRGETSLGDGSRAPKLDPRIAAYGIVDELNSQLGLALAAAGLPATLRPALDRVQNELFDVGADLSVPFAGPDARLRVTQPMIDGLEALCDEHNKTLPELKSFVLPGGTEAAQRAFIERQPMGRLGTPEEIAALAVYFASSGIESLRIGLNRAYGVVETRNWLLLRLESIAYVLIGAVALLALAFLIVLGPLLFSTARRYAPGLGPLEWNFTLARYTVASIVLVVALVIAHKWLPAGRRRFSEIMPGIVATLLLWLASGVLFGRYLSEFAYAYVSYYAGLASVMVALVFLYFTASIFVFGGELNSAICRLFNAQATDGDDTCAPTTRRRWPPYSA